MLKGDELLWPKRVDFCVLRMSKYMNMKHGLRSELIIQLVECYHVCSGVWASQNVFRDVWVMHYFSLLFILNDRDVQ